MENSSSTPQEYKYINPLFDWGFKAIFKRESHKDLLITFLNDVFAGEKHITRITYLESDMQSEDIEGRNCSFDILCKDKTGELYIVEMQQRSQSYILDRLVYYTCRMYTHSGKKGKWKFKVSGVYTICITKFSLEGKQNVKMLYELTDREDPKDRFDKFKVIILQLTKIPVTYEECDTDLKKWLYLLVKMTHMGSITLVNEKKAAFKKLLKVAELTALTQEDRALYEEKVKVYRDYVNQLDYAIKEGIKKGRKEWREEGREEGLVAGIEKGREEGLVAGIEKGKDEGILLTASAMKSNGADIAFIAKCTGLSIGEIEKL